MLPTRLGSLVIGLQVGKNRALTKGVKLKRDLLDCQPHSTSVSPRHSAHCITADPVTPQVLCSGHHQAITFDMDGILVVSDLALRGIFLNGFLMQVAEGPPRPRCCYRLDSGW